MEIVTGCDDDVAKWASIKLGQQVCPPYLCVGFADQGVWQGAAIFNDYNGTNVELTIYGPGCLTREAIRFVFDYAFRQLHVLRVTARTRRGNADMRKLLPRIGFMFEGTAKRYFGPTKQDDALLFVMFPANADRWIKEPAGENTSTAHAS